MATIQKRQMEYIGPVTGNDAPGTMVAREGATQVFTVGDLLVRGSGGTVTLCGADPTAIAGMAESAASGVTDAEVRVQPNIQNAKWGMNVLTGASDYVLLSTDIGKIYGIARNSGQWAVDVSDTTNTRVMIEKVYAGSAIGDTNARVVVTFLESTRSTTGSFFA
jgi:hypothetical protein